MRFLLKEQPYERPIASGSFRYDWSGQPTGLVEHWRYTAALDGYHFLRVDLDGRASSGHSTLYNLLLNRSGKPEQLKYRFFATGIRIVGQLLFENDEILAIHERNGVKSEQLFTDTGAFWFPSAAGLGLMASHNGKVVATCLNNDMISGSDNCLVAIQLEATVEKEQDGFKLSDGDGWYNVSLTPQNFVKNVTMKNQTEIVNMRSRHYSN